MFAFRLFIIELKKMFFSFPKIAAGFFISVIIVAAICFGAVYYINLGGEDFKSTISVYIPENDKFLNLAIDAFENSGKIKDLYKIQKESKKENVEDAVKSEKATAGVIFEENFIDSIIKGKRNIPINIFISNKDIFLKNAVMKFAEIYKDILQNVQAGIYSVEKIYLDQVGEGLSSENNKNINIKYVNFVFSKYKYFDYENEYGVSLAEYYISMLFPLFLILLSIMAGVLLYSYKKCFYMCAKCSSFAIAFVQNMMIFILMSVFSAIIISIIYLIGFDIHINIIPLIFAVITVSVISNTVFFISGGNINGGIILFFMALLFSFFGGAIIPPSFLPEWIKEIYIYSPVYVIGSQFGSLFNSEYCIQGVFYDICIWIFGYFTVFVFGRKI